MGGIGSSGTSRWPTCPPPGTRRGRSDSPVASKTSDPAGRGEGGLGGGTGRRGRACGEGGGGRGRVGSVRGWGVRDCVAGLVPSNLLGTV